jgi:homoserine kinase type II
VAVLNHFTPHTRGLTWSRVGGGFSGALVWRGEEAGAAQVAVKAWPPGTSPGRVRQVHAWMIRAAHLAFVPAVYPGADAQTAFTHDGRVWECCRWQPGAPRPAPSVAEVEAACEAVAELHRAWSAEALRGPCPGVLNRLRILAEAEPFLRAGELPPVDPHLDPLLRRGLSVAARVAPALTRELTVWEDREFTLQPCVRDLRGEHVLFESDRVAGVVDYGAAAVDHPAVDLARLFIDFAPDEPRRAAGLNAYRRACGGFDTPDEFVQVLNRGGIVCSVLGWLQRLAVRREPVSDVASTLARLAQLVTLVEKV